jgi:hypothetical protein
MKIALITTLTLLATLFSPAAQAANTYPPENAALLYYKALDWYPPDGDIMDKIGDYAKGEIELDEEIVKHLDAFQHVIKELTVASDIPHCNWGIDFSEGINTFMPGLSAFKKYAYLLLSDARRLISKGDYYEAIDRCLTAEKFASHVGINTLINSLVATVISAMSDKCIAHIISETPVDTDKLLYLNGQFDHFNNRIERMKAGFFAEKQLIEVLYNKTSPHKLTYEMLTYFIGVEFKDCDSDVLKELTEKIKAGDDKFFGKALKYHIGIIYDATAAFDRPYQQACEILSKQIPEKLKDDAKEKPEALLANTLIPACLKCYAQAVRSQNSLNALKNALEIYLIQAKTGKLPDKLPANAIKDLYTDKAMVYEITDNGFTLRCQGADTEKEKKKDTYEFKVKK